MPRNVRIIDRDRGFKALMRRVAGAKRRAITIGVHSGEGGAPTASGGSTVADVATIHEFGLGSSPERSFIRAWVDEQRAENEALLRKIGESIVRGKNSVDQGLNKVGLVMVGNVQKRIRGGIAPANTPETVARKKSSTPLIDKSQLVSSITHKVE